MSKPTYQFRDMEGQRWSKRLGRPCTRHRICTDWTTLANLDVQIRCLVMRQDTTVFPNGSLAVCCSMLELASHQRWIDSCQRNTKQQTKWLNRWTCFLLGIVWWCPWFVGFLLGCIWCCDWTDGIQYLVCCLNIDESFAVVVVVITDNMSLWLQSMDYIREKTRTTEQIDEGMSWTLGDVIDEVVDMLRFVALKW